MPCSPHMCSALSHLTSLRELTVFGVAFSTTHELAFLQCMPQLCRLYVSIRGSEATAAVGRVLGGLAELAELSLEIEGSDVGYEEMSELGGHLSALTKLSQVWVCSNETQNDAGAVQGLCCLLYTSPSPRD